MVETLDDVLKHAEVIVVGNKAKEFQTILSKLNKGQQIVDLVRIDEQVSEEGQYHGICW
jgi:GDP-mannose 6-dehydrogenase